MDLKQLQYFIRVSELGSFAKAADLLGVAQPTLSRQVRALEVKLATSLFHRHGRGVMLTPAGARFAEHARGVLHAADAAVQVLQGVDRRMVGRVVCGMTPSVTRLMAPEYVRRFRQALPHATLSIANHLSTVLHDQLRASRLDFALLHNPPPSPILNVQSLGVQNLYLIGREPLGPDPKTVSLKALAGVELVMPSASHAIRKPLDLEASRLGMSLNIRVEIDEIHALFDLVVGGLGYTISTNIAVLGIAAQARLSVQRIKGPTLISRLALVTQPPSRQSPLQAAAIELATQTFSDLAAARR